MDPSQVAWQDTPLYVCTWEIQSPQHSSPGQSVGSLHASSMALPGQLPGAPQALWPGFLWKKQQISPGEQGVLSQLTLPAGPPLALDVAAELVAELVVDALLELAPELLDTVDVTLLEVPGAPP